MSTGEEFQRLTSRLHMQDRSYVLAELNDLLTNAAVDQIAELPAPSLEDVYLSNYVAAMVEQAVYRKEGKRLPSWTSGIAPLSSPVFGAPWMSLRPHLLLHSPVPFRRRNIFIDSSIGDRV